jgi:hypothetical protein
MFAGIGVDQVAPERMTSSATRLLLSPMPIVPARDRHRDGIGQPVARRTMTCAEPSHGVVGANSCLDAISGTG